MGDHNVKAFVLVVIPQPLHDNVQSCIINSA